MAEDHGAPEAGQLPRVWTRGRKETESRQRVSAHQEKKNEETKKGRRKEKVKTGDRFRRCCVLPFCGRSGGSIAKK